MGLNYRERSELHQEEFHLEQAIIRLAQRVEPPRPTEEDEMKRWRRNLERVRLLLGVVLVASSLYEKEEQIAEESVLEETVSDTPANPQLMQVADPMAAVREYERRKRSSKRA